MAINDDGWKQIQDIFGDKGVRLRPIECKILDSLLGRERIVPQDEIIDRVYRNDEDGGPLGAKMVVKVRICRLRKLIDVVSIPWEIVNHYSRGYQLRYVKKGNNG